MSCRYGNEITFCFFLKNLKFKVMTHHDHHRLVRCLDLRNSNSVRKCVITTMQAASFAAVQCGLDAAFRLIYPPPTFAGNTASSEQQLRTPDRYHQSTDDMYHRRTRGTLVAEAGGPPFDGGLVSARVAVHVRCTHVHCRHSI